MNEEQSTPVLLVAERFGDSGGGEAIKAFQYANYLLARGYEVTVFTHIRSLEKLGAGSYAGDVRYIADTGLQKAFWKSRVFRALLQPYFHLKVRALLQKELMRAPQAIIHYISPVSPVAPRFVPRGAKSVFGPMTGNIYYPEAFRDRAPLGSRLRESLHRISQKVLGRIWPEKREAICLLVSGYERTRASLVMAGCSEDKMVDVVDSGVSDDIAARPRIEHEGRNLRFVMSGRMVDHKGIDLAIKALLLTKNPVELDIFGDGDERSRLEALVRELKLENRVFFKGWVATHADLLEAFSHYRGYVFPSLAEANGIVMQEAMMMGLPVITLRWGGPSRLADADSALYIEPGAEQDVVRDIAMALDRLAEDGGYADRVSRNARRIADQKFRWGDVAKSWEDGYLFRSSHSEAKGALQEPPIVGLAE